jgi:TRAP-type C4-dicarboxylate transport system permease small subunit
MASRGTVRIWGWVLIALAVVALCWAGFEWWSQANGLQTFQSVMPDGSSTISTDWDQERQQSQVRMVMALVAVAATGTVGAVLLRSRRVDAVPVP